MRFDDNVLQQNMHLTTQDIIEKKKKKQKITSLTAYDYPSARILDEQGIDIILVGDSLGMVLLGYETTLPVTMEDMIHHTRAASKGVQNALLVADMPYQSYDSPESALENSRKLKEAGADAVKLEGGHNIEAQVKAIVDSGIPVMGHIGMTPQSVAEIGGYKVQGKDKKQAEALFNDAKLLQTLGAFSVVLECVPAVLAKEISQAISIPTIGIGAGPDTDGQVLVLHDMLGIKSSVSPKFVRKYASLETIMQKAVSDYKEDVLKGHFPSERESF